MTGQKGLAQRVQKAKAIQDFILVLQRDRKDRVRAALVPGSKAKRYHVILRRKDSSTITTECRLQAGHNGYRDCKGNSNGYICYHSIAAVLKASEGFEVSVCYTREDALRLKRLGGLVGILESHQGGGELWLVVNKR